MPSTSLRLRDARSRQHLKQLIDSIIKLSEREVAQTGYQKKFKRLISIVRSRSELLKPNQLYGPRSMGRIQQIVRVCMNCAIQSSSWKRQPELWFSTSSNDTAELTSVIDHLFAKIEVPRFLYRCWFLEPDYANRTLQNIFIHLAAGHSIRGVNQGRELDRRMSECFLQAPDHATFEQAIQFATTGRPVGQRIKLESKMTRRRFKQRVARKNARPCDSWPAIAINDFSLTDDFEQGHCGRRTWLIHQLTSRSELIAEGEQLEHCVAQYADDCEQKITSVWSMSVRDNIRCRRLLTIEVLPGSRQVVQIRGFCNRSPKPHEYEIIQTWAERESLVLEV